MRLYAWLCLSKHGERVRQKRDYKLLRGYRVCFTSFLKECDNTITCRVFAWLVFVFPAVFLSLQNTCRELFSFLLSICFPNMTSDCISVATFKFIGVYLNNFKERPIVKEVHWNDFIKLKIYPSLF